jgi:hypothetical protein
LFAGVIDGGDIASVKFTAAKLGVELKDNTCICHQLNNLVKKIIEDYFEEAYLQACIKYSIIAYIITIIFNLFFNCFCFTKHKRM